MNRKKGIGQMFSGARSIDELVGGVLAPIVARRAGMSLELLAAWPDLIGPPFGHLSRPEKILWPRRATDDDPFEPATLVVACDGSQAVFFQHETGMIIEKANTFFGFNAIGRIKIEQKPVVFEQKHRKNPASDDLTEDEQLHVDQLIGDVKDEKLRNSLEKLGRAIVLKQRAK